MLLHNLYVHRLNLLYSFSNLNSLVSKTNSRANSAIASSRRSSSSGGGGGFSSGSSGGGVALVVEAEASNKELLYK
ncbi:hypothetical protein HMPREF9093_00396 [Fusobacterium sp. oral taxon 370 str. F0437]|nr:hypothetical protein HMPREF9093_00396 [Fusobacterium sp. oral taxon 370 str. F0437]